MCLDQDLIRMPLAPMKNLLANCAPKFSSNLETYNTFCDDDGIQFFMIKRSEGDFSITSPFLIQKGIEFVVETTKTIKKLCSGELLIEV